MKNKIFWTHQETVTVFKEVQRILRTGWEGPIYQLWQLAQKVLPENRQRPITIKSSARFILSKKFKEWNRTQPLPTPDLLLTPRAQAPAAPLVLAAPPQPSGPVDPVTQYVNYCPNCGLDLRKVVFVKP